jgi:uncharacterized protein YegL
MSHIVTVACSAEKEPLFASIQDDFNAAGYRDHDGSELALRCTFFEDADIFRRGLLYEFDFFVPGSAVSSLSLREFPERDNPREEIPFADFSSFAASPVVLAMSPRTYDGLGGGATPESRRSFGKFQGAMRLGRRMTFRQRPGGVGWQSLVTRNEQLRLMHAHGTTPDGLAVMAAAWMWACGGREPSAEDATGQAGQLVGALEERVAEYAPDDRTVLQRFRSAAADVMLLQERVVLAALTEQSVDELVIVYPAEGTVWIEQVLGRARRHGNGRNLRHAHELLSAHLHSPQTATRLPPSGLHPLGQALGTRQDSARLMSAHPATRQGRAHVVNRGAPPLILPGYQGVRTIYRAWPSVAKAAAVCLVLDMSGSMSGHKLAAASEAVRRFCRRPQSTETTLGLVTFENTAAVAVPFQPIISATPVIDSVLNHVTATGGTAMFDAVAVGVSELERAAVTGHLRAIVLLTDGQENSSRTTLSDAQAALADAGVIVFAIAYGADADLAGLQALAGTSGLTVTASEQDIEEIYEALSAHV